VEPNLQNKPLEADPLPDNCPSAYFNGFAMALGAADVIITLQLNSKPTVTLNTSYTVAKTLAQGLTKVVEDLERATHTTILTTHKVTEALNAAYSEDSP